MIEDIQRANGGASYIDYGLEVQSVELDLSSRDDPDSYCVKTKATADDGRERVFLSKYVLVSDHKPRDVLPRSPIDC